MMVRVLLFFSLVTCIFGAVGTVYLGRRKSVKVRLQQYLNRQPQDLREESPRFSLIQHLFRLISSLFRGKSIALRWTELLEQAGIPLKPEEFIATKLLVGIFSAVLYQGLGGSAILAIVFFILGWLIPNIECKRRRAKRLRKCAAQLPVALSSISTSIRAGFSFMQALQMISKELPDPLGPEISKTIREMSFGISVEEAFTHLLKRLPNDDLDLAIMALLVQRTTGGNLSEILDSIQETVQDRIRIQEEIRTLTAQGRASAWVITLLPIILILLFSLLDPHYFTPMLEHQLGWGMIAYGVISGIVGWIVMKRVIRVEV